MTSSVKCLCEEDAQSCNHIRTERYKYFEWCFQNTTTMQVGQRFRHIIFLRYYYIRTLYDIIILRRTVLHKCNPIYSGAVYRGPIIYMGALQIYRALYMQALYIQGAIQRPYIQGPYIAPYIQSPIQTPRGKQNSSNVSRKAYWAPTKLLQWEKERLGSASHYEDILLI